MSEAADLRKSRGILKGLLTKSLRKVERLTVERATRDELESVLRAAKKAFAEFEDSHDAYVQMEKEEEQEKCDEYFQAAHVSYVSAIQTARAYLDSLQQSASSSASALYQTVNLPKVELKIFDGDPLSYHLWICAFDEVVDKVQMEDSAKLTRMLQYTCGSAYEAIKGCALADDGYKQARAKLKSRFGDKHLVTQSIVASLKNGKAVQTPVQLRQLADELSLCQHTLNKSSSLSSVDEQSFVLQISRRLPPYMQHRWRREAVEKKRTSHEYPKFADFCKFIALEADDANDPVYGQTSVKQESQKPKEGKNVFAMQSGESTSKDRPTRKCPLCSASHKLLFCDRFKKKTSNERLNFVNENNLCHVCLMANHTTDDCKRSYTCSCGGRHSNLIHIDRHVTLSNASSRCAAHVPVVKVKVEGAHDALAVLDTASDATFCSRNLVEGLGVKGQFGSFSLNTLTGETSKRLERVNLSIESTDGLESLVLSNVIVVDRIPMNFPAISLMKFPHLQNLPLIQPNGGEVKLLIGQDNAEALVPLEVCKGHKGEPFAVRTLFGWSLNGPAQTPSGSTTSFFVSTIVTPALNSEVLTEQVERWWCIENEGLSPSKPAPSVEDMRVVKYWDDECCLIDGHFQIPIPFKQGVSFPNNRQQALQRLKSLRTSLHKREMFQVYDQEIQSLLRKGYAEPAADTEASTRVWYLPHHVVLNPKKPGKVRIVFDCAARFLGESLNDKCLSGPDLINSLLHVLIRFRQYNFAFSADIEGMYYQVVIPEHERDVLRFLWFNESSDVVEFRMTRHVFGGVWCASSAIYALHESVNESVSTDVRNVVFRSFYVDDCLTSAPTEKKLMDLALGTKGVLQKNGFRLTKFVANSQKLMHALPTSDIAMGKEEIITESRILGVKWDVLQDEFFFNYQFEMSESLSRRKMLQVISSIYDPLGLISPMMVRAKVLLQIAVRNKCAWDEDVPKVLLQDWNDWCLEMKGTSQLRFPRCLVQGELHDLSECELHFFSDASDVALGCCCYLRCVHSSGQVRVMLVMSKSKVSPLKKMSIPRLELEAAVMAVKLHVMLKREMDIEISESQFWCDSEIVLKYISNESRRFQTFVANRVSFIRQFSEVRQWHHVPGRKNVADLISRGQSVVGRRAELWMFGPSFLQLSKCEWDVEQVDPTLTEDPEMKRQAFICSTESDKHPLQQMCEYYSKWSSLLKAVAWWTRLISILRGKSMVSSVLTPEEKENAELTLIKFVQLKHFSDEIERLSKSQCLRSSSKVKRLDPFIDELGLLRVGGRLRHSTSLCGDVHQILIPHDDVIASLIANHYHQQAHLGTEWVLSRIRQKYWITHGRAVLKGVSHRCVQCKKLFSDPCTQKMSDLPHARLEAHKPPFSNTGIDCFGPFLVKRARSEVKRYGLIFCCFSTRAVHLELLSDLSTDSFLNAFRRFVSRRGTPDAVWSDNATNFVGGQRAMFKLDESVLREHSLAPNVKWHYNVPHASHMGGVWERLIRTVRKVLTGVLPRNARLTDECLHTVLCEVEFIVNSRPLTKVSEDVADPAPLTPSHLLLLNSCSSLSPGIFSESDLFRRRWKCVQHIANTFWTRWLKEYLPTLNERTKWLQKKRSIKVGDLVLIKQENTPRGVWPLGLVVHVSESSDGLVRSVRLRLKNKSEISRPITKCVLLEASV